MHSALLPAESAAPHYWYACYTRARHERKVELLLRQRGVESYLAEVLKLRRWKDRNKRIPFVLFPNYIFVRCPAELLYEVVSTPSVVYLVRTNGHLAVIPEAEIANIRRFVQAISHSDVEPELVALPRRGEAICVTEGPFRGITGTVLEHRAHTRVLVGVQSIGWGYRIEVPASSVQRLSSEASPVTNH